jgi:hypothetical protein
MAFLGLKNLLAKAQSVIYAGQSGITQQRNLRPGIPMKKNASLFLLVSVLFILAIFTNLSAESPIPQGLSDLLCR